MKVSKTWTETVQHDILS